jgi:hypothetical protein
VLAEPVADPVGATEMATPVEVELVVGVKGAVIPNPGSFELGTLAAKAAKVFAPVVGGLMAPYMPPWQCYHWLSGPGWTKRRIGLTGFLAQKNQMGLVV